MFEKSTIRTSTAAVALLFTPMLRFIQPPVLGASHIRINDNTDTILT